MKPAIWLANDWDDSYQRVSALVPRQRRSACIFDPADVRARSAHVRVSDRPSVKEMSLSGWCLGELWPGRGPGGQGRVAHGDQHSSDRKHYFLILLQRENTPVPICSSCVQPHLKVIPPRVAAECVCVRASLMTRDAYLCGKKRTFFLWNNKVRIFFLKLASEASNPRPSPAWPSLAFDFLCVPTIRGFLVGCPAVDLLGHW